MCADDRIPTTVTRAGGSAEPERVGPYRISKPLGRGAMGIVYLATDERSQIPVALKILPRDLALKPHRIERFVTEAKAAGMLDHPAIARVYDSGVSEGYHYFAMEVLDGGSLSDVIHRARPDRHRSFAELLADPAPKPLVDGARKTSKAAYFRDVGVVLADVARALAQAHEHGILHRDIKPSNILFDRDGRARLCDFGLARIEGGQPLTSSNVNPCTPAYASPEQAFGRRDDVVPASDVYSLGATLYECLTGRPPFDGADTPELLTQIREAQPRDPRAIDPEVPEPLERIALRCLEKQPARRFSSAADLADDLANFVAGNVVRARSVPAVLKAGRRLWPRRWRVAATIGLVVAAALATTIVVIVSMNHRERLRQAAAALRERAITEITYLDYRKAIALLNQAMNTWSSEPMNHVFKAIALAGEGMDTRNEIELAEHLGLSKQLDAFKNLQSDPVPNVQPEFGDKEAAALLDLFLAEVLVMRHRHDEALFYLDRSIELNPSFAAPLLQRAIVYDRLGRWANAAADLEEYGRSVASRAAPSLIGDALQFRLTNDFEKAMSVLDRVPASDVSPYVRELRSVLFIDRFQFSRPSDPHWLRLAIDESERGLESDADNRDIRTARATAYLLLGQARHDDSLLSAAEDQIQSLIDGDRRDYQALILLGRLRSIRGDQDAATKEFGNAHSAAPHSLTALQLLISSHLKLRDEAMKAHDSMRSDQETLAVQSHWEELFDLLPSFDPAWRARLEPFGILAGLVASTIRDAPAISPVETGVPRSPIQGVVSGDTQVTPARQHLDAAVRFLDRVWTKVRTAHVRLAMAEQFFNRAQEPRVVATDFDAAAVAFEDCLTLGVDTPHVNVSLLYVYARFRPPSSSPEKIDRLIAHCREFDDVAAWPQSEIVNFAVGLSFSGEVGTIEEACRLLDSHGLSDVERIDPDLRADVCHVLEKCGR